MVNCGGGLLHLLLTLSFWQLAFFSYLFLYCVTRIYLIEKNRSIIVTFATLKGVALFSILRQRASEREHALNRMLILLSKIISSHEHAKFLVTIMVL